MNCASKEAGEPIVGRCRAIPSVGPFKPNRRDYHQTERFRHVMAFIPATLLAGLRLVAQHEILFWDLQAELRLIRCPAPGPIPNRRGWLAGAIGSVSLNVVLRER